MSNYFVRVVDMDTHFLKLILGTFHQPTVMYVEGGGIMALPRSKYVHDGQEGVYHCFSRCVRRAFLCGFDTLTLRDFSHRKALLLERLRFLTAIFAIEVLAYALMENHYHTILRLRPDIVATWSDQEVATRWLTLFPQHRNLNGIPLPSTQEEIRALADCPNRIALLRQRLCSLSWFMGRLNEFIARTANKEDNIKGRFWESRFKCQALLDQAAVAACMVYVDLNPIRASLANSPELSDFTSIQERILDWQQEQMSASLPSKPAHDIKTGFPATDTQIPQNAGKTINPSAQSILTLNNSLENPAPSTSWLCPIQSDFKRRGILQMTTAEYLNLVDMSGRLMRSDNSGAIDADLAPILLRIGANQDAWFDTVSCFGSKFRLAAGLLANLRSFANQLGRQWLKGFVAARTTFVAPPPQWA